MYKENEKLLDANRLKLKDFSTDLVISLAAFREAKDLYEIAKLVNPTSFSEIYSAVVESNGKKISQRSVGILHGNHPNA